MKRLIFLSLFAFHAVWIFCQDDNADAIYEKLYREYTLETDGSIVYREYKQLKLLSYLSFNRLYGETFIVHHKDYQQLKINESYTIMADGKIVYTPENAFNEVLLREAHLSHVANHLREMVVTHTALERGAIIVLDYSLISSPAFSPGLMGNLLLQESSPVKDFQLVIRVPADIELKYRITGLSIVPEISMEGNTRIFTWKLTDVSPLPRETLMGKYPPLSPRLLFTTASSLHDIFSWIVSQPAFEFKVTQPIKAFADSIRKIHSDEIKTLITIQQEVARNIFHESYHPSWLAYRCRTAGEIWQSNGGNRLEKSVLLATLLRAAQFIAEPVMTAPVGLFDQNAPNLTIFDGFFVRVNTKSHGTFYLSATETELTNFEYLLADHIAVPLVPESAATITLIPSHTNSIRIQGVFKTDQTLQFSGEMELQLTGSVNPFLTLQNDVRMFKSLLSGNLIGDDRHSISVLNSNPVKSQIRVNVNAASPFKEENGYYRWVLPVMNNGFERWRINYLHSERLSNVVLPSVLEERYHWIISVPKGYTVVNQAFSEKLSSAAGDVSITIKPGKQQIEVIRELIITTPVISPEEYDAFRKMINLWLDRNLRNVVLKAKS